MLVFVLTRVFGLWYADRPVNFNASYDVTLYERWADQVVGDGRMPYIGFDIEYPPVMMPVIVAPRAFEMGGRDYRHRFIPLMLLFDIAGFIGLLSLALRRGSRVGPWVWTAGGAFLGSVLYLRLDLVPAVATIWALELAARRRTWASGGVFALGALAKVYPGILFLLALASERSRRLLAGAVGISALILLPFVGGLDDMWRNVAGYHMDRGVQIESTWGAIGLFGKAFGSDPWVGYSFGAVQIESALMDRLEILGLVLSVATLIAGVYVAVKKVPPGDVSRLAAVMFATLCGLLFFGTVFSPQFVVWLIALAAVVTCSKVDEAIRWSALMVLVIAIQTHIVFPYFGTEIINADVRGLALLALRNLTVGIAGVLMFQALWKEPQAAEIEHVAEPDHPTVVTSGE